jgi:hypothetical protein
MSIYGTSTSGKTNIIKALFIYRFIIIESINIQNYYFPNKLNNKYDATIFELEIFIGSAKFKHFIEYDLKRWQNYIIHSAVVGDVTLMPYQMSKYNEEKNINILSVECS